MLHVRQAFYCRTLHNNSVKSPACAKTRNTGTSRNTQNNKDQQQQQQKIIIKNKIKNALWFSADQGPVVKANLGLGANRTFHLIFGISNNYASTLTRVFALSTFAAWQFVMGNFTRV